MRIKITFKHLPRSGKYLKGNKYYVTYNSKSSIHADGNKHRNYRIPKWLWKKL